MRGRESHDKHDTQFLNPSSTGFQMQTCIFSDITGAGTTYSPYILACYANTVLSKWKCDYPLIYCCIRNWIVYCSSGSFPQDCLRPRLKPGLRLEANVKLAFGKNDGLVTEIYTPLFIFNSTILDFTYDYCKLHEDYMSLIP